MSGENHADTSADLPVRRPDPVVRAVTVGEIIEALADGLRDFQSAPIYGLSSSPPTARFSEWSTSSHNLRWSLRPLWRDRLAAAFCLVPLAVWVAFATVLNFSIWILNR